MIRVFFLLDAFLTVGVWRGRLNQYDDKEDGLDTRDTYLEMMAVLYKPQHMFLCLPNETAQVLSCPHLGHQRSNGWMNE